MKDPKFVCVEGVEDTNYPLQPPINDDPFEHIKNEPYFSFNRFYYNEPWFHEDSHEPYNSLPERGYANGQDPLDNRNVYSTPQYLGIMILTSVFFLYSLSDPTFMSAEASIGRQVEVRHFVEDYLVEKNKEINELLALEAELLKKTGK